PSRPTGSRSAPRGVASGAWPAAGRRGGPTGPWPGHRACLPGVRRTARNDCRPACSTAFSAEAPPCTSASAAATAGRRRRSCRPLLHLPLLTQQMGEATLLLAIQGVVCAVEVADRRAAKRLAQQLHRHLAATRRVDVVERERRVGEGPGPEVPPVDP